MANYQVGIIGLGKFGLLFGKELIQLGHTVIGIDRNADRVQHVRHEFSQVYHADASDKETLEQLGFGEFPYVLVSVGNSIASSTMIAMYLKELEVATVWVKGVNADHEKLLRKVGVDDVIIPENTAAKELADRLAIPGFLEYLPFGKDIALKEIEIDRWAGKSLKDLNLPNKHRVQIIAVKKGGAEQIQFIPDAEAAFDAGDVLIAMGHTEDLKKLKTS